MFLQWFVSYFLCLLKTLAMHMHFCEWGVHAEYAHASWPMNMPMTMAMSMTMPMATPMTIRGRME